MNKDYGVILMTLVLVGVLLIGTGFLAQPIQKERKELKLTQDRELSDSLPPEYVLMSMAGGAFRNVLLSVLWVRMTEYQDEGELFQVRDLGRLIVRLQPRFPRAWDYLAWNEAYNISVTHHAPKERWIWVKSGIDMLQTEAIPVNPRSTLLYRQLAYYYRHKMFATQDNMHQYYRLKMASIWTSLLGNAPQTSDKNDFANWIRPMERWDPNTHDLNFVGVVKPVSSFIDQLVEEEAADENPDNDGLINEQVELLTKHGFNPDEADYESTIFTLRMIAFAEARLESPYASFYPLQEKDKPAVTEIEKWLQDPKYDGSRDALIWALRAAVVMGEHRMSPKKMIELTETFGPMDWRHPVSHSLYWAHAGVKIAANEVHTDNQEFELVNTRGMINAAIKELYRAGEVRYELLASEHLTPPDEAGIEDTTRLDSRVNYNFEPEFTEAVFILVEDRLAEEYGDDDRTYRANTRFLSALESRLQELVVDAFLHGADDIAARYYLRLQEEFKDGSPRTGEVGYAMSMEQFVMGFIMQAMTDEPTRASNIIYGWLNRAVYSSLVMNRQEESFRYRQMAQVMHNMFNQFQQDIQGGSKRLQLPPLEQMLLIAFDNFYRRGEYPPIYLHEGWGRTPISYRRLMYDPMLPMFKDICERNNWDLEKTFPEPPGMEEFRKLRDEAQAQQNNPFAP